MRITSGIAGGRTVKAPKGLRPTQDRVREAYFSKVGSHIADSRFLDLFAGSGAVGLEAWSRGASECVLVEKERSSVRFAQQNAKELGTENVRCVAARVELFLVKRAAQPFNLIYADPPYALAEEPGFAAGLLQSIEKGDWLEQGGIVTVERRSGPPAEESDGWVLLDSRKYGESALDYYYRQ